MKEEFNEQTNHMRFLPKKKTTEHDDRTPYEEMLDAVIDARGSNPSHPFASSEVLFTPGVPTEDGWYVVKTIWSDYTAVFIKDGELNYSTDCILSHAKLPEL
jgi:hypothetical protein